MHEDIIAEEVYGPFPERKPYEVCLDERELNFARCQCQCGECKNVECSEKSAV